MGPLGSLHFSMQDVDFPVFAEDLDHDHDAPESPRSGTSSRSIVQHGARKRQGSDVDGGLAKRAKEAEQLSDQFMPDFDDGGDGDEQVGGEEEDRDDDEDEDDEDDDDDDEDDDDEDDDQDSQTLNGLGASRDVSPGAAQAIEEVNRRMRLAEQRDQTAKKGIKEFEQHRARHEKLQTDGNPFGQPMLDLMVYFDDLARERSVPDTPSNPMATSTQVGEAPLLAADIVVLEPEGRNRSTAAAWLTDNTMGFLAQVARTAALENRSRHFVAMPLDIHFFAPREGSFEMHTDQVVAHLKQCIQQSLPHVMGSSTATSEGDIFPVHDMPRGIDSLSILYNIGNVHWVHVELQVNRSTDLGTIILHNSMTETSGSGRSRRKAGSSLSVVRQELPLLAKLIGLRPSLDWTTIRWPEDEIIVKPCPQQANSSDCGLYAWRCAMRRAEGQQVDGQTLGKALRWWALQRLSTALLQRELPDHDFSVATNNRPGDHPPPSGPTTRSRARTGTSGAAGTSTSAASALSNGEANQQQLTEGSPETDDDDNIEELSPTARKVASSAADIRQILCNIMLRQPDELWQEPDIQDRVVEEVQSLAAEVNVDITGEEELIRARTTVILKQSTGSFRSVRRNHLKGFIPDTRIGHLVDTRSQQDFLSSPTAVVDVEDDIDIRYNLLVSIVRNSENVRWDQVEAMQQRAPAQVKAFWNHFGYCQAEPDPVTKIEDLKNAEGTSWMPYYYTGSSSDVLLDTKSAVRHCGQTGLTADRFREALEVLNEQAKESQNAVTVGLIQSGPDGGSANNDTWKALADAYKQIRFRLIIVCQQGSMWDENYFRIDRLCNGWASFDIDRLASLYNSERANAGLASFRDEHHGRLLTAVSLIRYFKDDCSNQLGHQEMAFGPQLQNRLAAGLTKPGRKSFPLLPLRVHNDSEHAREHQPSQYVALPSLM
ncbi:hypothetical protein B0A50_08269 [Salinomyces thailandicus]|uniref:Ubiquitin-like protease family profile domain-containing protein n=1 Tax=Salinomyces thailandicus TaxID=706561 RepID=A0A4U0TKR4_9PEZI|nr:hypothetical protein B0A50_08269 [Salinomyces thailandica]